MRRTWNGTWVEVRITSRSSSLDGGLLYPGHLVFPFEHVVCPLKCLVYVSQLDMDARGQVALRVALAEGHVVRLIVDHRRARGHAGARVEDGRELFILDLD